MDTRVLSLAPLPSASAAAASTTSAAGSAATPAAITAVAATPSRFLIARAAFTPALLGALVHLPSAVPCHQAEVTLVHGSRAMRAFVVLVGAAAFAFVEFVANTIARLGGSITARAAIPMRVVPTPGSPRLMLVVQTGVGVTRCLRSWVCAAAAFQRGLVLLTRGRSIAFPRERVALNESFRIRNLANTISMPDKRTFFIHHSASPVINSTKTWAHGLAGSKSDSSGGVLAIALAWRAASFAFTRRACSLRVRTSV